MRYLCGQYGISERHACRVVRVSQATVLDVFTPECLAVEPGHPFGAAKVGRVLSALAATRGGPRRIFCDNGSEFAGQLVDLWAYANKVTLAFSRPGKPTDNVYIESFNGSFREECLNLHWFKDLTDARAKMQVWKQEYNEDRPHRSLKNLTPLQYKAQWYIQRSENR